MPAEAFEQEIVVPAGVDMGVNHVGVAPVVVAVAGDVRRREGRDAVQRAEGARQIAFHVVGGDRRRT
jgi:hypothetical protein